MDGTEGQVAIPGNIVGCPWDAVRVGMPVTTTFLPVEDDVVLPQFTPVHASAQHSEE
jgi:hypothetical protein